MNLAHPSSRVPRFRALISAAGSPPGRIPALLARWRDRFWKFLDSVEERELAPVAFTTVLPLESMTHEERTELLDRLRELNGPSSPLMSTPGICRMRLTVRADSDFDVHRTECYPFGALVVDCTHARDREDFLYELFEMHGNVLDAALKHCRDYPGMNVIDACVRLLFSATEERKVAANDPCKPIPLSGLPQLHEYEHEVPDERLWIERAALLARTASRKKTRAARRIDPEAKAVRGVHPKHHGLLQAKFLVRDDLPLKFRLGAFKPGAKYDALIRVSNMSTTEKPDIEPDARGLAIKLEGLALGADRSEWQVGEFAGQDFLLASHPVFFVKDVRDYTVFQRLLAKRGPRFALFMLRRPREQAILKRALRGGIDHPLNLEYHSMIPYALGSWAVKYLVRPVTPISVAAEDARRSNDYLRERMQRTLDPKTGQAVRLEFCLVVPTSVPPSVEDARADWKPDQSTIVPVATIEIERQDFSTPQATKLAENVEFTPWHTLRTHRPLGSLGRARLAVYRESAEHRAQANLEP
ncbi:MAG TPA: hypothetical protein VFG30_36765 [Polyangiales bacterium]|nr:hypothetical protein [Polyangiales bacterium]